MTRADVYMFKAIDILEKHRNETMSLPAFANYIDDAAKMVEIMMKAVEKIES